MSAERPAARSGDEDAFIVLPEGTAPPGRVPAGIFAAAVDVFVSGQRLDMRSLARRLGVARATLYRRVGNREQLLDEMLWWRARRLRISDGFLYADVIADRVPDIDRAITVIKALLLGLDLAQRRSALVEAEVSGQPGHPQRAEVRRGLRQGGVDHAHALAVGRGTT